MNRLKKKETPQEERTEVEASGAKVPLVLRAIKSLMDGSFLSGSRTLKRLPFFLFAFVLTILYVANTHNAEKRIRQTAAIKKEINDLKSEYMSLESQLSLSSTASKMAVKLQNTGISESKEPIGGTVFYTQNDLKPFLDKAQ